MVAFGGIYFALPRELDWRLPRPHRIALHFSLVAAVTGRIFGSAGSVILLGSRHLFHALLKITQGCCGILLCLQVDFPPGNASRRQDRDRKWDGVPQRDAPQ